MRWPWLWLAGLLICGGAAAEPAVYGAELEGFDYPWPVQHFNFESQRQPLQMAYLDIAPERPNGQTALLLHGKNFCAATWEKTIAALSEAGYRVIAPDQIGFCKSSKPEHYQFTLSQLAANTHALIERLGVKRLVVIGHSMGGMLAARYTLEYPVQIAALVLVNPIGLEDWQAEGVPYQTVDGWYQSELNTTFDSIKAYQRATYYNGEWRDDYERWARMLAGMYAGPGRERVAWNQALTTDMVFTQPVLYEFPQLLAPTLVMIGERDTTAIGKQLAPPAAASRLGRYAELGRRTVDRIPNARLIRFPELGHSPQVQAPERFNKVLLDSLAQLLAQ